VSEIEHCYFNETIMGSINPKGKEVCVALSFFPVEVGG